MSSAFDTTPASVCILRLSAIGDTCHVLPVVRTLQRAWPRYALHLDHRPRRSEAARPHSRHRIHRRRQEQPDGLVSHAAREPCAAVNSTCSCTCSSRCARACCRRWCRRDQARLRPRARARAAMAVHDQSHPARRAAARHGLAVRLRREIPCLREAAALGHSDPACRARLRAARDPRRREDAHHQPLLQPSAAQLAAPSTTRRSPTTRSATLGLRVVLCGGRSDARTAHGRGDRAPHAASAARTRSARTRCSNSSRRWNAPTVICHAGLGSGAHGDGGRHSGRRPVCRDQSRAQRPVSEPPVVRRQVRCSPPAGCSASRPPSCPGRRRSSGPGVMDLITPDEVIKKLHSVLLALARRK